MSDDELSRQAALFMDVIEHAFSLAEQNITRRDKNPLFWNLREALISQDIRGLTKELKYSFQSFMVREKFSKELEDSQKRLLDFRFPHEWFPATRTMQRTIHVHVGPTNSGKTYNALKALENSKSGGVCRASPLAGDRGLPETPGQGSTLRSYHGRGSTHARGH